MTVLSENAGAEKAAAEKRRYRLTISKFRLEIGRIRNPQKGKDLEYLLMGTRKG